MKQHRRRYEVAPGPACAGGPGNDDDDDDEVPIGEPPDEDEGEDWDEEDEDEEEPWQVRRARVMASRTVPRAAPGRGVEGVAVATGVTVRHPRCNELPSCARLRDQGGASGEH